MKLIIFTAKKSLYIVWASFRNERQSGFSSLFYIVTDLQQYFSDVITIFSKVQ